MTPADVMKRKKISEHLDTTLQTPPAGGVLTGAEH